MLKKISLLFVFLFVSGRVMACAGPGPSVGGCSPNVTVDVISSSAKARIEKLNNDFTEAGDLWVESVKASEKAEIEAIKAITTNMLETLGRSAEQEVEDELTITSELKSAASTYQGNLLEEKAKMNASSLIKYSEEVDLILNQLESGAGDPPAIIISNLKEYDEGSVLLEVKTIEGKKQGCDNCVTLKQVTPSNNLNLMWKECSTAKRRSIEAEQAIISNVMSTVLQDKTTAASLSVANKGADAVKLIKSQLSISCSVDDYNANQCLEDVEPEQYVEELTKMSIIDGGNVSASSFLSPSCYQNVFEGEMSDQEKQTLCQLNTNLDGTEELVVQDSGGKPLKAERIVPLVSTYRTSSQAQASQDFLSNVIYKTNYESPTSAELANPKKVPFKQAFYSRVAKLNFAENSFLNAYYSRLGVDLTKKVLESDGRLNYKDYQMESFKGASKIDNSKFEQEELEKQLNSGDIFEADSLENETVELDAAQSKLNVIKGMHSLLRKDFEEILFLERMELNIALLLSQEINNKDMINDLKRCREEPNKCFN